MCVCARVCVRVRVCMCLRARLGGVKKGVVPVRLLCALRDQSHRRHCCDRKSCDGDRSCGHHQNFFSHSSGGASTERAVQHAAVISQGAAIRVIAATAVTERAAMVTTVAVTIAALSVTAVAAMTLIMCPGDCRE